MSLSTTGKFGFKIRVTPVSGVGNDIPKTFEVPISEQVNADVAARALAVTASGFGSGNVAFVETWLLTLNQV